MMATDILKQQHREFEELVRQIETAEDEEERGALRVELADMLAAHTAIEEELFYPAALEQLGPGSRINESLEEHAVVDFTLYRFVSVSAADETFMAKLATLKDVVMNHIEEEESELLPQVEGEMDRQVLEQLGDKMTARFEERLSEGHRPILERSLGIAARQTPVAAPVVAPVAAAKKAAPARRGTAKVKASPQKRAMAAVKRGSTPKRATATKKVAASKKAPARSQSTPQQAPTRATSKQNQQAATRAASKNAGRAAATRGQTSAKKSRAAG